MITLNERTRGIFYKDLKVRLSFMVRLIKLVVIILASSLEVNDVFTFGTFIIGYPGWDHRGGENFYEKKGDRDFFLKKLGGQEILSR